MKNTRIVTVLFLLTVLFACDNTAQEEVMSGVLEVPENRNNPNSRTLKLVYKVLKAKKADPSKAPIVYLQGGPGMPTLITEGFWANHPLRNNRDIVLMDQRGTGESEANCVNIGESMFAIGREDNNVEQNYEAIATLFAECKQEIQQKGVDLEGYNSRESAADFEDLRKLLGYKQWNLYGASYGSRLGFTIIRDFPKSVRSSILLGVYPPGASSYGNRIRSVEESLLMVFGRCEENEACEGRYPNLKERLHKVILKMQTEPLRFRCQGKPFVLNSHEALGLIFESLYDRHSIGNIPFLIEALENREAEPIIELLNSIKPIYDVLNFPMAYSVIAYEDVPFFNNSYIDMAFNESEFSYAMGSPRLEVKLREDWHPYRATSIENQPVVSDIPTLLLSGELDPVTPPRDATGVLRYLQNGYGVTFSNESHDFMSNPCLTKITEDFLNDPFHKPNIDCSSEKGPIEWNLSKSSS